MAEENTSDRGQITFRLDPSEKAQIDADRKKLGFSSVSEYLRALAAFQRRIGLAVVTDRTTGRKAFSVPKEVGRDLVRELDEARTKMMVFAEDADAARELLAKAESTPGAAPNSPEMQAVRVRAQYARERYREASERCAILEDEYARFRAKQEELNRYLSGKGIINRNLPAKSDGDQSADDPNEESA